MHFDLQNEYQKTYDLWTRWSKSRYRTFSRFLFDEQNNEVKYCIGCKKETPHLFEYRDVMICKQCKNGRLRKGD